MTHPDFLLCKSTMTDCRLSQIIISILVIKIRVLHLHIDESFRKRPLTSLKVNLNYRIQIMLGCTFYFGKIERIWIRVWLWIMTHPDFLNKQTIDQIKQNMKGKQVKNHWFLWKEEISEPDENLLVQPGEVLLVEPRPRRQDWAFSLHKRRFLVRACFTRRAY